MLQLQNRTPFESSFSVFPNIDGVDTLFVNVKATFLLGQKIRLADQQIPPSDVDDYYDDPLTSSLKSASDAHIGKNCTDIIMQGGACAPEGNKVRAIDVRLSIGDVGKTVRVFGNRYWQQGSISEPEPFEFMPLVYERAYGGSLDEQDEGAESYDKNPVGVGFAVTRSGKPVDGSALPNLETPHALIAKPGDMPEPAGFSYVAPYWKPRAQYAGTYDHKWEENRAPYLPEDFNQRFLQVAPSDQIYPGVIRGGEPVEIEGMHPKGKIQFVVPSVSMACRVEVKDREVDIPFITETLLIQPNDLKVSLVWKASFVGDKDVTNVKNIFITLKR